MARADAVVQPPGPVEKGRRPQKSRFLRGFEKMFKLFTNPVETLTGILKSRTEFRFSRGIRPKRAFLQGDPALKRAVEINRKRWGPKPQGDPLFGETGCLSIFFKW